MNLLNLLRIGLDIDDVLCKWEESYCEYFGIHDLKEHTESMISYNVQNILIKDKQFWINLPRKHRIDFYPTLYCTKRCIPKSWTIEFLKKNKFPVRPIIQILYTDNKAKYLKNKIDLFIDDSISNFKDLQKENIKCFLMDSNSNKDFKSKYRIYSITKNNLYKKYYKYYGLPQDNI